MNGDKLIGSGVIIELMNITEFVKNQVRAHFEKDRGSECENDFSL